MVYILFLLKSLFWQSPSAQGCEVLFLLGDAQPGIEAGCMSTELFLQSSQLDGGYYYWQRWISCLSL